KENVSLCDVRISSPTVAVVPPTVNVELDKVLVLRDHFHPIVLGKEFYFRERAISAMEDDIQSPFLCFVFSVPVRIAHGIGLDRIINQRAKSAGYDPTRLVKPGRLSLVHLIGSL